MNSREEWVVHVAIHRLQGGRIINSPMPPLLFHHLHPHPDGPSASWVWKSGKPIHLLYWCFLQIVPSTSFQKRGDIGDTKSYYLVVNLRRKQPTIGLFSLSDKVYISVYLQKPHDQNILMLFGLDSWVATRCHLSDQFCTGSVNFLAGYLIGVCPSNPYKNQKSS